MEKTKNKKETRTSVIPIRLTQTESLAVKASAKECVLSVSEFIRRALFSRRVVVAPPEVNRNTYSELCRIGNNLNQIAKQLHQGYITHVDEKLLKELQVVVRSVGIQLSTVKR